MVDIRIFLVAEFQQFSFKLGDSRIVFDIEVDFGNGHVDYTVVGKAALMDDLSLRFNRITRKTRLHVPVNELCVGTEVYRVDGEGPYTLDYPFTLVYPATGNGSTAFFGKEDYVGVEFYYATGEGVMCGSQLILTEEDLEDYIRPSHYTLEDFVNGCKFDLFAVAYHHRTRRWSVFTTGKARNAAGYWSA